MDRFELQSKEFAAMQTLAGEWRRLSMTAIVDDDYPSVRRDWETAVQNFLQACADNGRKMRP